MILSEAIEQFLLARHIDGRRAKTVQWYGFVLKPLAATYGHYHIESITSAMLRTYIAGLMKNKSPETVKSINRGLHAFWSWAATEYGMPNPMANIAYPKRPKQRELNPLTMADIERLFVAARESPVSPDRDSLILWLLLDTGIRAAGLCGLKWTHIDMGRRVMWVVEKGDKGRNVAFSAGTGYLLRKWQYQYGQREHVFCGVGHRPLTTSGLYQIVKRMGRAAGIKNLGPHALRHNFAMNWMAGGGEIVALKNQMGHTSIETTISFYLRYAPSQLVAAHRSPLGLQLVRPEKESKKPTQGEL